MNKQLSPLWTHLTSESRITGTWRSALPNYLDQPSPCLGACPVNGRIAEWIKQVKDGDIYDAWVTLTDNNPFPAIAGRICHHPCETACNRKDMDETVGICSLERYVGDMALIEGWAFSVPAAERSQSIAIIGGGPAGLSAAFQLRRYGFCVSIFEAKDELGGLMRYGIPSYRLERDILNGEIDRIIAMGIDLHLGIEVMDSDALAELNKKHDAVFLATGASLPKRLPTLDYSQSWVIDSAEFLAAALKVQKSRAGSQVLVIGGGSAAMDVARSARRLGSAVTVLTLEPEGSLPAQETEVEEAIEEGVVFVSGATMQSMEVNGNDVTISCANVELSSGGATGAFTITPVAGSEFELTANTIIPAIGQEADIDRWNGLVDANGAVLNAKNGGQTCTPGIYAGGDVASVFRFVTEAVGMGKEAARSIAASLASDIVAPALASADQVGINRINIAYQDKHARTRQNVTALDKRLGGFEEVQLPLGTDEALTEAMRCFSCGTCIFCDNCYFYCPDVAISKTESGYEVNTDYCKGCGLCVVECPTGSIHMQEDTAT